LGCSINALTIQVELYEEALSNQQAK
jgi:hypothetical protein